MVTGDEPIHFVRQVATEYVVSVAPLDDRNARYFALTVRSRIGAPGTWMVTDGAEPASYIGADGRWCWESLPEGDLPDDWRAAYRFDLDTALRIAREAAPKVVVNGGTWAQWQARFAERRAES